MRHTKNIFKKQMRLFFGQSGNVYQTSINEWYMSHLTLSMEVPSCSSDKCLILWASWVARESTGTGFTGKGVRGDADVVGCVALWWAGGRLVSSDCPALSLDLTESPSRLYCFLQQIYEELLLNCLASFTCNDATNITRLHEYYKQCLK